MLEFSYFMLFCQPQLWWLITDCVFNHLRNDCLLHDITTTWGDAVHDATYHVHSHICCRSKPWSPHRSSHECGGMYHFLVTVQGWWSRVKDCCGNGLRFTSKKLQCKLFFHLWESQSFVRVEYVRLLRKPRQFSSPYVVRKWNPVLITELFHSFQVVKGQKYQNYVNMTIQ